MKASELIAALEGTIEEHGDLEIAGGYISDDRGPEKITVLNEADSNIAHDGGKGVTLFLE